MIACQKFTSSVIVILMLKKHMIGLVSIDCLVDHDHDGSVGPDKRKVAEKEY